MPKARAVSAEEFARLGDGKRELLFGRVVEMTPGCGEHGQVGFAIEHRIRTFLERRPLGTVFNSGTGYLLARHPDLVHAPDVSFVASERLAGVDMRKFLPLAPDLAVEVVSPGDTARDVDAKARMWIRYGARLVWVVHPKKCRVRVYRPGRPREEKTPPDSLSGEDVRPGFVLPVSDCL